MLGVTQMRLGLTLGTGSSCSANEMLGVSSFYGVACGCNEALRGLFPFRQTSCAVHQIQGRT